MKEQSTENRILCLEQATKVKNPHLPLKDRFDAFCEFVGDDPLRFACLRLAVNTHGVLPRIQPGAIVEAAEEYLKIISTPAPVAPQQPEPSRRGRKH